MRIGIDARMYGPQQGGLGRYVEQLIAYLEKITVHDELVIFLRKENWNDYVPKTSRTKKVLANIPWYGYKEQLCLTPIIKKEKVDLMHFPHWNVPLFYNNPFVVTIHDLLLLHYPTRKASTLNPINYWLKQLVFKRILRSAAKRAQHIISVSEFSKHDIHGTLHIPLEKITVTYPAPFTNNYKLQATSYKLKRNNITKPYVLYVGVAYPHKNLTELINAWKIFQEKYGNNYQLVLAGKKNYFYDQLQVTSNKLQTRGITFTDFVPDEELGTLYQNASLYIFPSLYEGFGLPPLEAITHNVPVVASNRTCLPEILKTAAHYFNPSDPNEIAEAINEGLNNNKLREKLIMEGQKIVSLYSWEKLAKETLAIYKNSV